MSQNEIDPDFAWCLWAEDEEGIWQTDCENMFVFNDAGPNENGFVFCPYCGSTLIASGVGA